MIYKIDSGVFTPADIRADFPNTSFPADISKAVLPDGYIWAEPVPAPVIGQYESAAKGDPEEYKPGKWRETWAVTPWTVEEIAAYKAEQRKSMSCGPWQLRQALRAVGLYEAIKTAMANADELAQEAWEYASEFRRLDPLVEGLRISLGKTHDEVDAIFVLAMGI